MKRLKIILQSKRFIVLSLIFITIYSLFFTKIIKYDSKYRNGTNTISGIILDYASDGDKLSLLIKSKEKITVTYYYKTKEEKIHFEQNIKFGTKIEIIGEIKEPAINSIPHTFNYQAYLYNKRIYKMFNAEKIKILQTKISLLYKIKNAFLKKVQSFDLTKEYMFAFILGDNNHIDSDIYGNYRANGVTHLFAVSGMHVSFLVLALKSLLKKIKIKEGKVNIIIILFLLFYMFLIGFSASVVRASLLTIALLINKKAGLNLSSLTILYLIFFSLILINPFYLYDLGFIYSFLTSFGLMLFSKKIRGCYFKRLFLVSFIAFIFSLPVTIFNFYEFNLLTILNNIIVVPFVSLLLFPLTLISFVLPFLERILFIGIEILEYLNTFLSTLSINIVMPKINVFFLIIYYLIIYLIYKYGYKLTLALVLLIFSYKISPIFNSNAYVYFIDVGQGDCTLFITEHMKDVILIDTGGSVEYPKEKWQTRNNKFNLASNIVTFLKSLGIDRIDSIICTHGDIDHVGYAEDIIKSLKVKSIMVNNNFLNNYEKKLVKLIKNIRKNNYVTANITIHNLNNSIKSDENDSSLVLYITLKNHNFLIMGDAPKMVETEIINKYNLPNIDVLKVGHHGSKTSTDEEFVNTIKPKYSIISVGKNNRYGHPNKEVLENLKDSKIYRTDLNGSVMFKLKKDKLKINTCPP